MRPRGANGGSRLVAGSEPEPRASCLGGVLPEARVGSALREPVRKHRGPPTFAPEVSRGTAAPLQEPGRGWRAPVGKVRDPEKLQPESGGKKGIGSHKPPRVKVRVTRRPLKDSSEFLWFTPQSLAPLIFELDNS